MALIHRFQFDNKSMVEVVASYFVVDIAGSIAIEVVAIKNPKKLIKTLKNHQKKILNLLSAFEPFVELAVLDFVSVAQLREVK